jgi:mannose-6-phosphate isomerase-like protein (cupin superfamily)
MLSMAPGADLVIAEWTAPPGERFIAQLHIHHEDDEAWYVLDGALTVRVGDQDVELAAGESVIVPRGTPHTYRNASDRSTRYLLVMTRRIHDLVEALHAPGARDFEAMFREYRSELLGWP